MKRIQIIRNLSATKALQPSAAVQVDGQVKAVRRHRAPAEKFVESGQVADVAGEAGPPARRFREVMNPVRTMAFGTVPVLASGAALAQGGHMMDGSWGGWMGGYGGFWIPILVIALVAAIVVLIVQRK